MIQFNIHRFRKVARWSLTNDKSFYMRMFLQMFVVLTLTFLFFTTSFYWLKGADTGYKPCCVVVVMMLFFQIAMGPSMMFYSMKGKYDKQALLLLPASNFEKYLMRYATWIVLFGLWLIGCFGADLVQYVINWLIGNNPQFVIGILASHMKTFSINWECVDSVKVNIFSMVIITFVWFHSCFALGATFFRSARYSWILTILVLIFLSMVQTWLFPNFSSGEIMKDGHVTPELYISDAVYGIWAILNYWLSYKLFCRTQNIGKFVNL